MSYIWDLEARSQRFQAMVQTTLRQDPQTNDPKYYIFKIYIVFLFTLPFFAWDFSRDGIYWDLSRSLGCDGIGIEIEKDLLRTFGIGIENRFGENFLSILRSSTVES